MKLFNIVAKLEKRTQTLEAEAGLLSLRRKLTIQERRQSEHLVYQLQIVWECFVREYVVNSALGKHNDRNGPTEARIARFFSSKEAVANYIVASGRSRYEPKWYSSQEVIAVANRLRLSNFSDISAAIGVTPWPLEDLRLIRNFFAHRSKFAAIKVRNIPWFNNTDDILVENTAFEYSSNGVLHFEEWARHMRLTAQNILG